MAKASVATIFRAYYLASGVRETLETIKEYGGKGDHTLSGMNYGEALAVEAKLDAILQGCDLEVEIPPESEPLIGKLIEISRPRQDSGEEDPPESLGWRH